MSITWITLINNSQEILSNNPLWSLPTSTKLNSFQKRSQNGKKQKQLRCQKNKETWK